MGGTIAAGIAAIVVGGGLAFATVAGVVGSVQAEPEQSEVDVMDYGTTE